MFTSIQGDMQRNAYGTLRPQQNITASKTLKREQTGTTFTNLGASGTITFTLKNAIKKGTNYVIRVVADQAVRIDPGDSGAFYLDNAKQTDGKYVELTEIGTRAYVEINAAGDWYIDILGAYSIEA